MLLRSGRDVGPGWLALAAAAALMIARYGYRLARSTMDVLLSTGAVGRVLDVAVAAD